MPSSLALLLLVCALLVLVPLCCATAPLRLEDVVIFDADTWAQRDLTTFYAVMYLALALAFASAASSFFPIVSTLSLICCAVSRSSAVFAPVTS